MIYTVNIENNKIQARYEAWEMGSFDRALTDIRNNGAVLLKQEVNALGDMILWVRFE